MTTPPLLSVRNLRTVFAMGKGREFAAVDDVSFDVAPGETLGIVGESGSGKSITALTIMGLLPKPPARVAGGEVLLEGVDLLKLGAGDMQRLRGGKVSMIFQEPMTSLNPVFTIGDQLMETIRAHDRVGRTEQRRRAIDLLTKVGIASADRRLSDYPHQLSGGMRQRVMIAIAIACSPRLLIADEPTTALDVTIQSQILHLLDTLRRELGMAVILITHNLGVVAEFADRVMVMYAGRAAEVAPVDDLFETPRHPYTRGLLDSIPQVDDLRDRLATIPGMLPDPKAPPPGCRFQPRCGWAEAACGAGLPELAPIGPARLSACLRHAELAA
jgi:peptide/nickel transport system ATP-binding protein/oligopeptide transport system ATP-binding protein